MQDRVHGLEHVAIEVPRGLVITGLALACWVGVIGLWQGVAYLIG